MKDTSISRREFVQLSLAAGGAVVAQTIPHDLFARNAAKQIPVNAHLWVYASAYPPTWDCTPVLDQVFSDLRYAGISGVELMEVILRRTDAVEKLKELTGKYELPVSGTSYGANMWDSSKQNEIIEDAQLVVELLKAVGGKTFGISVGDAGRMKTEQELDIQAAVLSRLLKICKNNNVVANLHNHTYEVTNNLHDLKGTLKRLPEVKLGPDLNWLIRGGVDPVQFIQEYGEKIVYLHIRDQDQSGTWTETVGTGVTDFKSIAEALHEKKFNGMAAIELAFPKDFVPSRSLKEDWKISRDFVRSTFGW